MSSKKKTAKALDNGFSDVSAAADAAAAELEDVTRDDDGIAQVDTTAQATVTAELSHRWSATGEGGGPWPAHLLQSRFLRPIRRRP